MREQSYDPSEVGYCDYCDEPYILGSETDHNPETGNHFECEMGKTIMKIYTVTMTGTYFVTANRANEAVTKVYEALLGNPIYAGILGSGEVNPDNAVIQFGTHFTIQHGNDNEN